jgi:NTE family protein
MSSKERVGLALSGGSALGIAHIGVVDALQKNNIAIDCVSGTSAGAIVASGLAFGVPLDKMIELSRELSWANLSRFGYSKLGLNSNKPVGAIIDEMIGRGARIEDAKIPLAIIATDIDTGEKIVFKEGSVAEAVMASTCLPGFFVPVKINNRRLVDGGLVENLPLSPLKEMGADICVGVDLGFFRNLKKARNIVDVITNSYSILLKPQDDLLSGKTEFLIRPHLEKFHSSDFKKSTNLIDLGYQSALEIIPKIKKCLKIKTEKEQPKSFWKKIYNLFHF